MNLLLSLRLLSLDLIVILEYSDFSNQHNTAKADKNSSTSLPCKPLTVN